MDLKRKFDKFILENNHPCIMAQSVFSLNNAVINDYEAMLNIHSTNGLLNDLELYIKNYDFNSKNFKSFIATFSKDEFLSESEFEKSLWKQLKMLSELDHYSWDPSVNSDPEHENFSFSLCGRAFYIVGMFPNSSRLARKSPYPTIVFNLHQQFEKLREMGKYTSVKNRIRKRDEKLQGYINPMLEDFGENSEARQYSGREVDKDWKCPFH